jgi:hypothetical protein
VHSQSIRLVPAPLHGESRGDVASDGVIETKCTRVRLVAWSMVCEKEVLPRVR